MGVVTEYAQPMSAPIAQQQYVPLDLPWEMVAHQVAAKDKQQANALTQYHEQMDTMMKDIEDLHGPSSVPVMGKDGSIHDIALPGEAAANKIKTELFNKQRSIAEMMSRRDLTSGSNDVVRKLSKLKQQVKQISSPGGALHQLDEDRRLIQDQSELLQEAGPEIQKDVTVGVSHNDFAFQVASNYSDMPNGEMVVNQLQELTEYEFQKEYTPGADVASLRELGTATDTYDLLTGVISEMEEQGRPITPGQRHGFFRYGKETYRKPELIDKVSKEVIKTHPELKQYVERATKHAIQMGGLPAEEADEYRETVRADLAQNMVDIYSKQDIDPKYKNLPTGTGGGGRSEGDMGEVRTVPYNISPPGFDIESVKKKMVEESGYKEEDIGLLDATWYAVDNNLINKEDIDESPMFNPVRLGSRPALSQNVYPSFSEEVVYKDDETGEEYKFNLEAGESLPAGMTLKAYNVDIGAIPHASQDISIDGSTIKSGERLTTDQVTKLVQKDRQKHIDFKAGAVASGELVYEGGGSKEAPAFTTHTKGTYVIDVEEAANAGVLGEDAIAKLERSIQKSREGIRSPSRVLGEGFLIE